MSFAVTAAIAIAAMQIAIIGAILGYLIGIPWSIWFDAPRTLARS